MDAFQYVWVLVRDEGYVKTDKIRAGLLGVFPSKDDALRCLKEEVLTPNTFARLLWYQSPYVDGYLIAYDPYSVYAHYRKRGVSYLLQRDRVEPQRRATLPADPGEIDEERRFSDLEAFWLQCDWEASETPPESGAS